MRFIILTLFPKAFDSYFSESILKRAQKKKLIDIEIIDIRKYTSDTHHTADDRPYGGGPGMVMKAEPILRALDAVLKIKNQPRRSIRMKVGAPTKASENTKIILLDAAGKQFTGIIANDYAKKYEYLIFICGHYEGIDARTIRALQTTNYKLQTISIGPYVLTGGELPAMVMIDAIARHIPGVLGKNESLEGARYGVGVPVYTRPEVLLYKGKKYRVPKELTSGNHKTIETWRRSNKKKICNVGLTSKGLMGG